MTYHFNVTGPERKALVKAISEHLGIGAKYLGVPSCAFKVGRYTVSKDGALSFEDEGEEELIEETRNLIANLQEAGFHAEELNLPEPALSQEETDEHFEETAISGPADSEENTLCISLPRARLDRDIFSIVANPRCYKCEVTSYYLREKKRTSEGLCTYGTGALRRHL